MRLTGKDGSGGGCDDFVPDLDGSIRAGLKNVPWRPPQARCGVQIEEKNSWMPHMPPLKSLKTLGG
jgi:hypothetical protein